MLGSVSFRQRLRQIPVDRKVLQYLQNNLKIGRTKKKNAKGDRIIDIETRQKTLQDTFPGRTKLMRKVRNVADFPITNRPEICFAGRSNVGKSSLINSLLNVRPTPEDAKVSSKPGETKSIDFYKIIFDKKSRQIRGERKEKASSPRSLLEEAAAGIQPSLDCVQYKDYQQTILTKNDHANKEVNKPTMVSISQDMPIFVDFPGYGFAFANEHEKFAWTRLAEHYFARRKASIGAVCLLLDARHGLKQSDRDFLTSLSENQIRIEVVLTKGDLVSQDHLAKICWLINNEVNAIKKRTRHRVHTRLKKAPCFGLHLVSSKTYAGIIELRNMLFRNFTKI